MRKKTLSAPNLVGLGGSGPTAAGPPVVAGPARRMKKCESIPDLFAAAAMTSFDEFVTEYQVQSIANIPSTRVLECKIANTNPNIGFHSLVAPSLTAPLAVAAQDDAFTFAACLATPMEAEPPTSPVFARRSLFFETEAGTAERYMVMLNRIRKKKSHLSGGMSRAT